MNYAKPLPKLKDIRRLSQAIDVFPVSTRRSIGIAEALGYGKEVTGFLKLFRGEFESRADFYARTSELVMLIREERRQPKEGILSRQD